jgi:hypothetical protein
MTNFRVVIDASGHYEAQMLDGKKWTIVPYRGYEESWFYTLVGAKFHIWVYLRRRAREERLARNAGTVVEEFSL